MPMTPGQEPLLNPSAHPAVDDQLRTPAQAVQITLGQRLWRALFGLFALEIGLFLAVYPWTDYWNLNHLPTLILHLWPGGQLASPAYPNLDDFWDQPYFRGAVTVLGALNFWIAIRALIGAFRRS